MAAKLRINDPTGKLVFDSSIHKVMSHLFSYTWSYVVTPAGNAATLRLDDARIKPLETFAFIEYVSVSANKQVYRSTNLIDIKYFDGYLTIKLPNESTHYTVASVTVTYKVKVFNR
ncbi:MAG: hypothetical protein RR285_00010 [Acinetobacter sp.]